MRSIQVVIALTVITLGIWLALPDGPPRIQTHSVLLAGTAPEPTGETQLQTFYETDSLQELEQAHEPASDFWVRDSQAQAQRIERILAAEREARTALVNRFGPQVASSAAHWQLFRPLHERMPKLSSEAQIRIHELERNFAAESLSSGAMLPFAEHLSAVRNQLGDEIADEYALRASPLANELLNAEPALSESEFRDAFAALRLLGEAGDAGAFVAARRRLREHLGSRRFARFWATRDPRFERVESTAREYELTDDTILTVWSTLLEREDALMAAMSGSDSNMHQDELGRQYEDGRRRLSELVGERAADAILMANAGPPLLPPN